MTPTHATPYRVGVAKADTSISRTAGLMDGLRSMPLFRQLVPMEAIVGWPVPVRHQPTGDGAASVFLKIPLSGYRRPERRGEPSQLFPPFAMITLDWASGKPVEYVDFRYSRPWPIAAGPKFVGEFPHSAVRAMTVNDYRAARERLGELYDGLFESLRNDSPFSREAEFGALLGRLLEPGLRSYYRTLAPKFAQRFLGHD